MTISQEYTEIFLLPIAYNFFTNISNDYIKNK